MKLTWEQRGARNHKHALNPKVGDYWHECFAPYWVVVDVSKMSVTVCETIKDLEDNRWTWDTAKTKTYSRKEFKESMEYSSMPNKYHVTVEPRAHKWAADAAIAATQTPEGK